jgi:hypothetical protein
LVAADFASHDPHSLRPSLPGTIGAGLNSVIARTRTRTNRSPILRSSVGALPARPKWFTVVTGPFCFKVKVEHRPSTMVAASIQVLIVQSTPDFAAPNPVAHIGSAYRILRGAHVSDEVSRRCICSQSGPACIAVSQFDVPRACHFLQAGASACSSLHATSRRPVCLKSVCPKSGSCKHFPLYHHKCRIGIRTCSCSTIAWIRKNCGSQ